MCIAGSFLQGMCFVNVYYRRSFFCFDLFSEILTSFLFIYFGRFGHENSIFTINMKTISFTINKMSNSHFACIQ